MSAVLPASVGAAAPVNPDQGEIKELRNEVRALRSRISEMEDLKDRLKDLEERLLQATSDQRAEKEAVSEPGGSDGLIEEIEIGGAFRFNTFWKSFDESIKTRRGDVGLDLFRLNVKGRKKNILISAEYRWYPYMDTLHHGWVGYEFDNWGRVQAGITRVPFGLLPYAAHNFWFGIPYYLGLADDYDAGLKYVYDNRPWNVQLAFFKNGELADATNLERYSYDLVAVGPGRNEEDNQVNARLAYTFNQGLHLGTEVGLSLQYGQMYNRDTDDNGRHWAGTLHLDGRSGRWNYQLELGRYGYDPRNPPGVSDSTVNLGAFNDWYEAAAQGTFGAANIAYNLRPPWQTVDSMIIYNDFSFLFKDKDDFKESYLNTTGCAVGIGPVFSYIDLILGRNMKYFGDGSLAGGGSRDWEARFNLNIGYYF